MSDSPMKYILPLDGLRGIAVLLVIVYHWLPNRPLGFLPIGSIGVDIFFVLSGFLITGILIQERAKQNGRLEKVKNFIIRRSLRIFPLYYGVLIVLTLLHSILPNPVRSYWPFFFSYLQNFLFIKLDSFIGGKVGHLWTLAVEEQFYLLWPWLVLFVGQRFLPLLLWLGIWIGVLCSFLFPNYFFFGNSLISVHPLTCIQAFCIGGYLSYLMYFSIFTASLEKIIKYLAILSLFSYFALKAFYPYILGFDRTLISVFIFWVIYRLSINKYDGVRWLFDNAALIFVGKISYGIYIFHQFAPVSLNATLQFLSKRFPEVEFLRINKVDHPLLFYFLSFSALITLSYLSFRYYERPFLLIKRKFV